jgi:predicted GH43/DUF377 family glycosyl hydrolase
MDHGDDCGILTHSPVHLRPDPSRTVLRPFEVAYPEAYADAEHPRARNIVDRVLALDDAEIAAKRDDIVRSLSERHRDVAATLNRRFEEIAAQVPDAVHAPEAARTVIGAYAFQEYSFEAAALFNPSMALHPDQDRLPPGTIRFIIALRGIGEGHVSSVTFRLGTWSAADGFAIEDASTTATSPRIEKVVDDHGAVIVAFEGSLGVSERVFFPITPSQRQGIEDMRLVRFVDDDGTIDYYGTYTAFDGRSARSELMRRIDRDSFEMRPMTGDAAAYKGMALFPRRIDGRYRMLGRMDNESIWLLASDDVHHWDGGAKIVSPRYPWEFVQMGNCGPPIEIDEGWLVLTHGVGMVRNYCVGACLLDRDDPSKLIARTPRPLLRPSPGERDGYVPNVVYSCGGLVHDRTLLLPYGVADSFTGFATCEVDALLGAME